MNMVQYSTHTYIPSRAVRSSTLPRGLDWRYKEMPSRISFPGLDSSALPVSRHPYGVIVTVRRLTDTEIMTFGLTPVEP